MRERDAGEGDDGLALDHFTHDARLVRRNAVEAISGTGTLLLLRAGDVHDEAKECTFDGDAPVRGRDPPAACAKARRAVVGRRAVRHAQPHDVAGAVEAEHGREVDQHVEGEALGGGQGVVRIDGEHVAWMRESGEAGGVAPQSMNAPMRRQVRDSGEHAARDCP